MEDTTANPIIVALMFLARCLVPLAIMLGVSYLLRRWGLITEPPPLEEAPNGENEDGDFEEGDLAHGEA